MNWPGALVLFGGALVLVVYLVVVFSDSAEIIRAWRRRP